MARQQLWDCSIADHTVKTGAWYLSHLHTACPKMLSPAAASRPITARHSSNRRTQDGCQNNSWVWCQRKGRKGRGGDERGQERGWFLWLSTTRHDTAQHSKTQHSGPTCRAGRRLLRDSATRLSPSLPDGYLWAVRWSYNVHLVWWLCYHVIK